MLTVGVGGPPGSILLKTVSFAWLGVCPLEGYCVTPQKMDVLKSGSEQHLLHSEGGWVSGTALNRWHWLRTSFPQSRSPNPKFLMKTKAHGGGQVEEG